MFNRFISIIPPTVRLYCERYRIKINIIYRKKKDRFKTIQELSTQAIFLKVNLKLSFHNSQFNSNFLGLSCSGKIFGNGGFSSNYWKGFKSLRVSGETRPSTQVFNGSAKGFNSGDHTFLPVFKRLKPLHKL